MDRILDRICEEMRSAFGFSRAMIVRYRPESRTVHAVVQQGIFWAGDEWLLLEKFPFLERAVETQETVYVRDASAEQAMPASIAKRFGVGAIVAVPLLVGERCLGFIVGDRAGDSLDLADADLDLLDALARVAAVFIAKADQYAELETAVDELRRVDQAKTDFISIASHELRTPIAVVQGVASTLHLRGDELAPEQLHELRRTMYEQAGRLSALAEQLLDLSKLDAGAVDVRPESVRPREHIDTLLPRLVPDRLKDVLIAVEPDLEVETDPRCLERIVSNLILNALEYGRPPVEVTTEPNGTGVFLVVQDHGDGVDAEFVPRLFDRFSRSDSTRRGHPVGAGLGLSIAREYARAVGGDLIYEPARPTGARFKLRLPKLAA